MATHSSTLAWKIPWEEPGRLQSMGSLRVGHDWAASLSLSLFFSPAMVWDIINFFPRSSEATEYVKGPCKLSAINVPDQQIH